jgi:hypothetical protein
MLREVCTGVPDKSRKWWAEHEKLRQESDVEKDTPQRLVCEIWQEIIPACGRHIPSWEWWLRQIRFFQPVSQSRCFHRDRDRY